MTLSAVPSRNSRSRVRPRIMSSGYARTAPISPTSSVEFNYLDAAMSYRYRSKAISLEEPDDELPADDVLHPSGKPGSRLAHVPLVKNGVEISTHDLVGQGFVLLVGHSGSAWIEAARALTRREGAPLTSFLIGRDLDDPTDAFLARTGLGPSGALIVRPDGFIAWRSVDGSADAEEVLTRSLDRARCLDRHEGSPSAHAYASIAKVVL